jgi:hypothetical protein
MFNSICAIDLKQKVTQTFNASMKTNVKEVEVHVTGPFQNAKWCGARVRGTKTLKTLHFKSFLVD